MPLHLARLAPDEDVSAETYRSPGAVALDGRGPWLSEFREDLARYAAHHDGSRLRAFLLEQGLWALLQYRLASACHRRAGRGRVSFLPWFAMVASQKLAEAVTGISLPFQADIAPGLYIGHFGPTLVNAAARIGPGCNLSQGVSIGVSGRGDRRGAPVIGARVYVGANAVVAGPIVVGDDVVIGANAVVVRDVAPGSTVTAGPPVVVPGRGSSGMGLHQRPAGNLARRAGA